MNAKVGASIPKSLEKTGHKKPSMPIQTDNSIANSIITHNIQPKVTKTMDMCFHWLWDHEAQEQFCFYWRLNTHNWADYWMKHHPASHHCEMRAEIFDNNVKVRGDAASSMWIGREHLEC